MQRGQNKAVLTRLTALAVAAVSAVLTTGASANTGGVAIVPSVTSGSRYLALGDSVSFGYQEGGVRPAPNYTHAGSFRGFPEILGRELHVRVANAACPGETTGSLINSKAPSNGCENAPGSPHAGYRTKFPLHVHYTGGQLAYAMHYLRQHHDVSLVTLMIGANDGFLCIETTKDACASKSEMARLRHRITHNVHTILRTIRRRAHYQGQLVIVNYYSPFKAYDPRSKRLNSIVDAAARPFNVLVAQGFAEFRLADSHLWGQRLHGGVADPAGPTRRLRHSSQLRRPVAARPGGGKGDSDRIGLAAPPDPDRIGLAAVRPIGWLSPPSR